MKEVNLKLTLEEANAVLNSLGNLPFVQVHQLIDKIKNQAGQQLNGAFKEEEKKEEEMKEVKGKVK